MEYWGAILELPKWSDQDYRLWWEHSYTGIPLKLLPEIESSEITYNQLEFPEFGRNLCTLYAWLTMHSCNNNQYIEDFKRKELSKIRYEMKDFNPSIGGYLVEWIKCVVDNKENGIYYRIHKTEALQLLNKGYIVNIGIFSWNDKQLASSDGIITSEEIDTIKDKKTGHSTCLKKDYRIDSYEGVKKHNKVKIEDIEKYINSWFVFDWAYVIVPNKVIRRFYSSLLKRMDYQKATNFFVKSKDEMYPRERDIFQYCLQKRFMWSVRSEHLKYLVF